MDIFIIVLLILGSGFFSGLTIGLMGISRQEIERLIKLDDKHAIRIYPIIKDSHLLLVTLLLGNTAINATLSIFLSSVVGAGFIAGLVSTVLILIFGEILPASLLSKYALVVGSYSAPVVKFLMFIFYPVTKPIAFLLDTFIKNDVNSFMSKREFKLLVDEHCQEDTVDFDTLDGTLIKGSISLSAKKVGDHMTKKFFSVSSDIIISANFLVLLREKGLTRIPVIKDNKNLIGLLYVKDLLGVNEGVVSDFIRDDILSVNSEEMLDDVLHKMVFTDKQYHMAFVYSYDTLVGVITHEDILEEIYGKEVVDESD